MITKKIYLLQRQEGEWKTIWQYREKKEAQEGMKSLNPEKAPNYRIVKEVTTQEVV